MSVEIWAIGGGKGGSGKSFLTSGLAMYLASIGKKVTVIDADLGGANLHSILKINKPQHSLTDFFERRVPLSEIIEDTNVPNLRLVIGDIRSLSPDNVKYSQRLKLYRHIRIISGDYVLIDLGAGSALNTLDTFLLADKLVTVTLPELTSIDNLYLFMKKVIFRKLNMFLAEHNLKNAAKKAWQNRDENNLKTIKHLVDHFKGISGEVSTLLDKEFSTFNTNVVVNQVRHDPHRHIGASIKSVIIKYFGIHAFYAGSIRYNDTLWKYLDKNEPFLRLDDGQPLMEEIAAIARNLMADTQVKLTEIPGEE